VTRCAGTFSVNNDFYSEATVRVRSGTAIPELKGEERVLISGMADMNRAVNGDVVAVELLPKADWKAPPSRWLLAPEKVVETAVEGEAPEGKEGEPDAAPEAERDAGAAGGRVVPTGRVVAVEQRNWRQYCGALEPSKKKSGSVLFVPANRRIPKIRIETRQVCMAPPVPLLSARTRARSQAEELMDKRLVVAIDSWPASSRYPLGHYVRALGNIGDRDAETAMLLMEHEVRTGLRARLRPRRPPRSRRPPQVPDEPWTTAVLKCLPPLGEDPALDPAVAHAPYRLDIRPGAPHGRRVMSVDPPGCKDIDDALHAHKLPNGNFEARTRAAALAGASGSSRLCRRVCTRRSACTSPTCHTSSSPTRRWTRRRRSGARLCTWWSGAST
jgi:exosome complex exonuclease DIS3/RRP44